MAKDTVTRYVATYINKDGMRTLMYAQQGRNTKATPEEVQQWINAVRTNNSASTLKSAYGDTDTFEVRACECYPGHFDPVGIYFDTEPVMPFPTPQERTSNILTLDQILLAMQEAHGDDVMESIDAVCDKAFTTGDTDVVLVKPNRFLNVLTHEIPEDVMSELRIALGGADYIEL